MFYIHLLTSPFITPTPVYEIPESSLVRDVRERSRKLRNVLWNGHHTVEYTKFYRITDIDIRYHSSKVQIKLERTVCKMQNEKYRTSYEMWTTSRDFTKFTWWCYCQVAKRRGVDRHGVKKFWNSITGVLNKRGFLINGGEVRNRLLKWKSTRGEYSKSGVKMSWSEIFYWKSISGMSQ